MTTTSTFQGMDSDGKPSSRVLNPPGGASNNIFGYNNEPVQKTPIRNNPDNVNRGNNDIFHQSPHAAAAQPKSRAPRSGDDSFHNLFGNSATEGVVKNHHKRDASAPALSDASGSVVGRDRPKSQGRWQDTFSSVFGEHSPGSKHMLRKIKDPNDNSFSRVFGHSNEQGSGASTPTNVAQESFSLFSETESSTVTVVNSVVSSTSNLPSQASVSNVSSSKFTGSGAEGDTVTSFSRLFGEYRSQTSRSGPKRFPSHRAFNPITGEAYDQPKATSQPQASAPEPAAVNNTNLDPSPGAVAAGVEEKPQEPQNDPAPQPAAAAAPAAQKRQQSGGSQIFGGGADDASQHRSTRVSQPPGGRSTKLW